VAEKAPDEIARLDELVSKRHAWLREVATACMQRERRNHTLGVDGLIGEAYLRLRRTYGRRSLDEETFVRVVPEVLRRVLIDHSRRRHARKRRNGVDVAPLETADGAVPPSTGCIDIDDALRLLARRHPRQAFAAESIRSGQRWAPFISAELGCSIRTVEADLRFARAWLLRELLAAEVSADPHGAPRD